MKDDNDNATQTKHGITIIHKIQSKKSSASTSHELMDKLFLKKLGDSFGKKKFSIDL